MKCRWSKNTIFFFVAYFDLPDPGSAVLYKSVQISGTTVMKAELALLKRPADSWPHGQTPEMSSAFGLH